MLRRCSRNPRRAHVSREDFPGRGGCLGEDGPSPRLLLGGGAHQATQDALHLQASVQVVAPPAQAVPGHQPQLLPSGSARDAFPSGAGSARRQLLGELGEGLVLCCRLREGAVIHLGTEFGLTQLLPAPMFTLVGPGPGTPFWVIGTEELGRIVRKRVYPMRAR